MATKKYNPYNDVKQIVDYKGRYADAKSLGQDPSEYQAAAAEHYNNLHKNGYDSAADKLTLSNYRDAKTFLDENFKPDEEFELDNWYDSIGKISTGDKETGSAAYKQYVGDLASLGVGQTAPKTSDSVSKLMEQWFADNSGRDSIRQKGSDYLDYLKDFDYTQQSYYQPIMDTYSLYGSNAANGKLASGSAANGGNIDSYSAANAARQQLAFTNAGHQAALAAAKQNQDAWQNVYGMTLDDYTNAGNALLAQIGNMYSTDASERATANSVLAQLFGDESVERQNAANTVLNKYLADLGLEEAQYATDANERMNTANNNVSLEMQRLANELGLTEAQLEAAMKQYATDAEVGMNAAQLASAERVNAANNTAARNEQYWENQYKIEEDKRKHEYEKELEQLRPIATEEADEDEYTPDVLARNIIEMVDSGDLKINSWEEFADYLTQNGVSSSDAATQMNNWKKIRPTLFGSSGGLDLNNILGTPSSKTGSK